jgi:DNA-binding transcriptional LysR family regulator
MPVQGEKRIRLMLDIDLTQLRRLDMTLLLVFAELVDQRKMTVVAQKLGLTQSAISHSLKRLRDLFQDELFVRGPNGLMPTERALRLSEKVAAILALSTQALNLDRSFDPGTETRVIRVGALDYEVAMFAAPLIERLRALAPKSRFVFRSLARKSALAELRASELDMALGFFFQPGSDIETRELYRESYSVVMRKGHRLARKKLTTERYAGAQHLLMSPLGELHGIVDASLARHRLERNVVGSLPLFLLVLATVAKTDLISTIPARLALGYGKTFGLSIAPPPIDIRAFPVHLAWHQRSTSEPALAWFRELMRSVIVDVASETLAGAKPAACAG